MHHFRRKRSSGSTLTDVPPPTPTSPIEFIKREVVRAHSKAENPKVLVASSASIALSIGFPPCNPSGASSDEASKESCWRMAYGTARMAVEIARESSDMFPPLKAVVGALAVLIKNYDQTTANAEQIRDIEERIQSLGEVLAPPVGDLDSGEKARREALQKKLAGIITRLGPLSEQHGLLKFLGNVDYANTLSGFVRDLAYAVTDYQTSIQQSIHETAKRIDENTKSIGQGTKNIDERTKAIDESTRNIGESTKKIEESAKKIDENTQNITEAADLDLLGKLDPVHNAGYQAGHHDTCLRGTRESILGDIMQWAKDPQDRHVFWLNGLAGTGKSTIAQTFSEMVANNGTLGASFFCSREYLDRKALKNIFPTLAYQLACRYPAFRTQIITAIKRDPSIACNSLMSQLEDLIVVPLSSTDISCVIVVDALDECVDDQPASAILSVLGRFVKQLPSVKFFITGRPEPRIRTGFRLPLLEPFTQIFLLHEVELSSVDEDIRLYLREKLTAIAKRRSDFDLSDPWPCDEDLTALTKKSSGLFIFASTLARFIESEHHEPDERLQLIVTPPESTAHEGRAGIDLLYVQVLNHAFSGAKEVTMFANLRRVLGALILAFSPLSRAQVAKILNIKPSLITATLRHLHSVLLVPSEDSTEIRVFHKSFPDFLQDPERCSNPNFFIASSDHHADMALGCLELLKKLKQNPCDLPDFVMNREVANIPELLEDKVGGGLRYACGHWAMHVRSSPTTGDFATRLVASATDFLTNNALPWIEVMSLENRLEGVIHSIRSLYDWAGTVGAATSNLYALAKDYLRFTMNFFHLIQQSAPHIYHSALPLSPTSMLRSTFRQAKTRIVAFHGRPDGWGFVMRTIKGTPGGFTCMTAIGNRIAAIRDDSSVDIYDSVTGVLRACLKTAHPIKTIEGSPDGSILFCTHQDNPSITMWDIQTGGPIYTFDLTWEAKDTAVSLEGRYLACALSDGSVKFWEVATKMKCPTLRRSSPITRLCWLAPEEQLVVANEASVQIRDVVSGRILHSFEMQDPVCGATFSQEFNQLAIMTNSGVESAITIINPQTGTSSPSYGVKLQLSCFAFSRTAGELVCGVKTHGLQLFNLLSRHLTYLDYPTTRYLDYPATITSVSTLSNGAVVANITGFGIQLLNLDEKFATPRHPVTSVITVHSFDKGGIISVVPTIPDRVILLDRITMQQLHTIPARKNHTIAIDRAAILCASLKKEMTVHCFKEGDKENLQLWRFGGQLPEWSVEIEELPSVSSISPTGARLVTFHSGRSQIYVCVRDTENGNLLTKLQLDHPWPTSPLDITFISDDQFYSHHDTYRVLYDIIASSESHTLHHSIICRGQLPSVRQSRKRQYCVTSNHEWVTSGSRRICWIPPGYIGSVEGGHCWAGSSLVMAGQDGILREFTFWESFF